MTATGSIIISKVTAYRQLSWVYSNMRFLTLTKQNPREPERHASLPSIHRWTVITQVMVIIRNWLMKIIVIIHVVVFMSLRIVGVV